MSADDTAHAKPLHDLVDSYTLALHHYVDVAVGVSAESSGPAQAVEDPRLEVAARQAALAMGELEDAATERLGLTADVGMAWEGDLEDEEGDAGPAGRTQAAGSTDADSDTIADAFHLHLAVVAPSASTEDALHRVAELVEEAGYGLVGRLEEAGFEVPEFGISRGDVEPFDLFSPTEEEDGDADESGDEAGR